jgi:hypothetical protein
MRAVDSLYKNKEDLLQYIHKFAKEFAPKGQHRETLKDLKQHLHADTYAKLNNTTISYPEIVSLPKAKL